jgi:hypothetical protein
MQNVNYKEIGSVDLNTFNMVGIYKVTSTCSNQPSNINTPYILENYEGFQIIKTLDRVYFRKRNSNNTWSDWNNPISDLQTQHNQDVQNLQNQINSLNTVLSLPVGTIILTYRNNLPNGFIFLNGGVLGKTNFYELWQFAQNNNLVSTVPSQVGLFIDLEAINPIAYPNKFRLPDFRGTFLRITGVNSVYTQYNGSSIGSFDFDKFRSHNHTYWDRWWDVWGFSELGNAYYFPHIFMYEEFSTSNAGSDETAPFRISVNAAIKYE